MCQVIGCCFIGLGDLNFPRSFSAKLNSLILTSEAAHTQCSASIVQAPGPKFFQSAAAYGQVIISKPAATRILSLKNGV